MHTDRRRRVHVFFRNTPRLPLVNIPLENGDSRRLNVFSEDDQKLMETVDQSSSTHIRLLCRRCCLFAGSGSPRYLNVSENLVIIQVSRKPVAPNEIEHISLPNPVAKSSLKPVNVSKIIVQTSVVKCRIDFHLSIRYFLDIIFFFSFPFLYLYLYNWQAERNFTVARSFTAITWPELLRRVNNVLRTRYK